MGGQYGIVQIKKILNCVVEAANILDKMSHGAGKWSFFQIADEFMELASVNMAALQQEVKELDGADRQALAQSIREKLVLIDKSLEAKIEQGADLVNESIVVGMQMVDLFKKIKLLFG